MSESLTLEKSRFSMHHEWMRHVFASLVFGVIGLAVAIWIATSQARGFMGSFSDTEPDFDSSDTSLLDLPFIQDPYANWERPAGPLRVGIQAGHWFAQAAPDEQEGLRDNTGAQAGSVTEWESNLRIAQETKKLLEARGVLVDLLPTTIPPDYQADAFISIHADGNTNPTVSGYKVASPRRDRSGHAELLSRLIESSYGSSTRLAIDPNITNNMRGYYAFNWRRYDHSIHPMTPAAIVETGFITNATDRRLLVQTPALPAQGISNGILLFLEQTFPVEWEGLLKAS